ncbi:hypothetical protein ACFQZZ_06370 [Nocardia sp. GCM10030253]|uniref:hypothetical protein n=1 Tax=Nocardia sp. GCM10030253 TaxID=3273404 RepID=UPI003629C61F
MASTRRLCAALGQVELGEDGVDALRTALRVTYDSSQITSALTQQCRIVGRRYAHGTSTSSARITLINTPSTTRTASQLAAR